MDVYINVYFYFTFKLKPKFALCLLSSINYADDSASAEINGLVQSNLTCLFAKSFHVFLQKIGTKNKPGLAFPSHLVLLSILISPSEGQST